MENNQWISRIGPSISQTLHADVKYLPAKIRQRIKVTRVQHGKFKYMDVGNYRFITQNPDKATLWAQLARQGHKVLWVIWRPTNKWLARIVDGKVTLL